MACEWYCVKYPNSLKKNQFMQMTIGCIILYKLSKVLYLDSNA